MDRDQSFLRDILYEAQRAQLAVDGLTYSEFLENWIVQYAVIRCLEIVGEAANQVTDTFQNHHPELPWSELIGMRNVLIHNYRGIEPTIVWRTLQTSIPELIEKLTPLINPES